MYHIRALVLTRDELWSGGVIQRVYLNDTEAVTLFCLGVIGGNGWEPLRVQGKIGYVYRSEVDAQEICARHTYTARASANSYLPAEDWPQIRAERPVQWTA